MEITIKLTDVPGGQNATEYATERARSLEKLLGADSELARCDIELARAAGHPVRGEIWRAEMMLHMPGRVVRAEARAETVNAAIDAVKEEMLVRLRHQKGKRFTLLKRGGASVKKFLRFGRGD